MRLARDMGNRFVIGCAEPGEPCWARHPGSERCHAADILDRINYQNQSANLGRSQVANFDPRSLLTRAQSTAAYRAAHWGYHHQLTHQD